MARKKLDGSYSDDEVTIIGNDPNAIRDLSIDPKEESIEDAVQKREKRLHRKMRIDNAYDRRFSMFKTKGTTVAWLSLAMFMFLALMIGLGAI